MSGAFDLAWRIMKEDDDSLRVGQDIPTGRLDLEEELFGYDGKNPGYYWDTGIAEKYFHQAYPMLQRVIEISDGRWGADELTPDQPGTPSANYDLQFVLNDYLMNEQGVMRDKYRDDPTSVFSANQDERREIYQAISDLTHRWKWEEIQHRLDNYGTLDPKAYHPKFVGDDQ
jgi:hypothetical protein